MKPRKLVRPNGMDAYIPYKKTQRKKLIKELLAKGLLVKVKLRPDGRAVAYTEDSIVRCQALMGLKGGAK